MNLKTFKAPTIAGALQLVKADLGHDAVILHTRTYQIRNWIGLRRREVVEITAGQGFQVGHRNRKPGDGPGQRPRYTVPGQPMLAYGPGSGNRPPNNPLASKPAAMLEGSVAGRSLLDSPFVKDTVIRDVTEEMRKLKEQVKDLVTVTRTAQMPAVPEELFSHYMQLVQNEVAAELAQEIVTSLKRELRPEFLRQDEYVREKLADHIEKLIPTSGPIVRKKKVGPHVLALIGPTGVGKTTTLAKLAANLQLKERHRVGLITLDTYRIAAVDQLKRYADIIRSPLKVVGNPEELKEAVRSMSDLDFILIDTAGRSPNDSLKLSELRTLLAAIEPDEVHLVLSSTSTQACVELAVQKFTEVRVDKIIFTKLDEAAHLGVVLNVVRKVKKSLSYVTTGQDVPDDIEVGRGRSLAKMILNSGTVNGNGPSPLNAK